MVVTCHYIANFFSGHPGICTDPLFKVDTPPIAAANQTGVRDAFSRINVRPILQEQSCLWAWSGPLSFCSLILLTDHCFSSCLKMSKQGE